MPCFRLGGTFVGILRSARGGETNRSNSLCCHFLGLMMQSTVPCFIGALLGAGLLQYDLQRYALRAFVCCAACLTSAVVTSMETLTRIDAPGFANATRVSARQRVCP